MMHKHRNFITLHISKFILMNSSGSKLNKITIMRNIIGMINLSIKIMMTSFMVIIILYNIHVIIIIIINRRHTTIITNLHIKSWGTKTIIFIKHSIPKLMALHIISIMDIHRIHTNNISIMIIIYAKHFIEFFFYQLSTIFRSIIFEKDIIKMNNMRQPQFHFFVVVFDKTKLVIKQETKRFYYK